MADKAGAGRPASTVYTAHPQRWGVLAVYAAASFMGALVWNILVRCEAAHVTRSPRVEARLLTLRAPRCMQAPVYAIAEVRFQRGPQAINSLANVRLEF